MSPSGQKSAMNLSPKNTAGRDIGSFDVESPPHQRPSDSDAMREAVIHRGERVQVQDLLKMRVLIYDLIAEKLLVPHISGEQIFQDMLEFYADNVRHTKIEPKIAKMRSRNENDKLFISQMNDQRKLDSSYRMFESVKSI